MTMILAFQIFLVAYAVCWIAFMWIMGTAILQMRRNHRASLAWLQEIEDDKERWAQCTYYPKAWFPKFPIARVQ